MFGMTRKQLDELKPLNEEQALIIQAICQHDLHDTINALFILVQSSDMSKEAKDNLLHGLSHISAHIHSEMREMTAEIGGRMS